MKCYFTVTLESNNEKTVVYNLLLRVKLKSKKKTVRAYVKNLKANKFSKHTKLKEIRNLKGSIYSLLHFTV